jgi:hypothetical protein
MIKDFRFVQGGKLSIDMDQNTPKWEVCRADLIDKLSVCQKIIEIPQESAAESSQITLAREREMLE